MRELLARGLLPDNLRALIAASNEHLPSSPLVFFVLRQIFSIILDRFESGPVDPSLHQATQDVLVPLIESVLDSLAAGDPGETCRRLEGLVRSFVD